MKPDELSEISGEKYTVKECCIYKDKKKICNFYIKKLSLNYHIERLVSYTITLKSEENKCRATVPAYYIKDPSGWLYYGFEPEDFWCISGKDEFDRTINEIISLMKKNKKYKCKNEVMGWGYEDEGGLLTLLFHQFDDPSDTLYNTKCKFTDFVRKYAEFTDNKISNVLFSYMLLSLLGSFDLLGENIRNNFTIVLTGSNRDVRRKVALFFANLYERNLSFGRNDYNLFHIMPNDTLAEMRFKAEFAKDCVLIAFEPDKRHLNYLINDIYSKRNMDEDHPVRSMCLITTEDIEKINHEMINIHLPENFSLEKMDEYFCVERMDKNFYVTNQGKSKSDKLLDSVCFYITALTNHLMEDKEYVNKKFSEYLADEQTPGNSEARPESAEEAATLLSFAYWLYISECYDCEDEIKKNIAYIINDIYNEVCESFVINGKSEAGEFEKAKEICKRIDSFFATGKNHQKIKRLGGTEIWDDVRMWYDDDYLYIKPENIKEILDIQQVKLSLSKSVKATLGEKGLIKKYVTDKGMEYSVHMQKNFYAENVIDSKKSDRKSRTKIRYMAFDRKECCKYELFKEIEKMCTDQTIDVK